MSDAVGDESIAYVYRCGVALRCEARGRRPWRPERLELHEEFLGIATAASSPAPPAAPAARCFLSRRDTRKGGHFEVFMMARLARMHPDTIHARIGVASREGRHLTFQGTAHLMMRICENKGD